MAATWLILGPIEMWSSRRTLQFLRGAAILAAVSFCVAPAFAQENQPPAQPQAGSPPAKPPEPYGGGSPLDVILSTRLWADVPEPKDFVKATRPPDDTINFQPTTIEKDPVRPTPKTAKELQDLQDELENAGARNETAAHVKKRSFRQVKAPSPKSKIAVAKTTAAKTSAAKTDSAKIN
jgi:hypothetical protein